MVVDEHDVRRVAMSLPDVTEDGPSFRVKGVLIAWPYPERVHPKKARVPRMDIFAIRVADLDDKEALIEGEPNVFFTTDHYAASAMLMVRLAEIDEPRLTDLLMDAHTDALAHKTRKRARRP